MRIGPDILTPEISHGMILMMIAGPISWVGAKMTCHFPPPRLNLWRLAKQGKKRSIYYLPLRETLPVF